ncbi:MAG TPA: electron transfer flavoprotein subunit beta/FixA family protein [Nitrososphaerales archaeon]|nr:electron transfer flavoprotein subunit beta/FixA family protein [Nitrososphaerales archaeon]
MKIAVCVKHAVDESELRADPSGKPILQGAASKVSTFDKNAAEEALRMKAKSGGEVVIVCVGPAEAKKTIREALAMGADKAVHVVSDASGRDSLATSYLLWKALAKSGPFDAVLCAEGSSDTYEGQVPPMLAEWMALPYAGYASKIELSGSVAKVEQSLEDSSQTLELTVPFVASVVSEINEPRYPTLIQIMQASKKPMEELTPQQLSGPDAPTSLSRVLDTRVQSMNRKKVVFEGAPEETATKLLDALKAEGVIGA